MDSTQHWDLHPEEYQVDSDGNFVLKKDGTPAKKRGKKAGTKNKYNFHSETKAKMATRKRINKKKRELAKLETKITNKRHNVKKDLELAKKLDGKAKDAVMTETDVDALPNSVKELIENDEAKVAFKAHPGPQTDFLASSETDVLYGGAAGGGKSYALLVDAIRYADVPAHRALLLRRTLDELEELIEKSRELYPAAFPGAQYKESKKLWIFPSGATLRLGYLEKDSDVYRYQGRSYSWIGFDELTQLATEFPWTYLRSRCRSTDPYLKSRCAMRATANPGGIGHEWVKARYIEGYEANKTYWETFTDSEGRKHRISKKFIPAMLEDNPSLYEGGEYEAMLMSMDTIERERLRNGDWDIADGAAFPEFTPKDHVIPPFEIPYHWERFKAIDFGHRAESCCLWFAVDPSDGTLIIYRELYEKGHTGTSLGTRMHDMESDEASSIQGILDGACWNKMGSTGPTVGEEMTNTGHRLRRADKNREAGKIQIHERLRYNEQTGRPKMQVFNTCVALIKQFKSIPLDPNNKEDVDTKAEDHAYDACRYGVMSRPRLDDPFLRMQRIKQQAPMPVDNVFGH